MARMTKAQRAEQLNAIAQRVGAENGYTDVKAEFANHRDMKVTWVRSYKTIEFKISDYLGEASKEALENLFEVIFKKIMGQDAEYSDEFKSYILSDNFIKKYRKNYLKRLHPISDAIIVQDDIIAVRVEQPFTTSSSLFKTISLGAGDELEDVKDEQIKKIMEGRSKY